MSAHRVLYTCSGNFCCDFFKWISWINMYAPSKLRMFLCHLYIVNIKNSEFNTLWNRQWYVNESTKIYLRKIYQLIQYLSSWNSRNVPWYYWLNPGPGIQQKKKILILINNTANSFNSLFPNFALLNTWQRSECCL